MIHWRFFRSRATFLLLWIIITLAGIVHYAGARYFAVITTALIEITMVGLTACCGYLLGRRLLPGREMESCSPALAFATAAALGLGVISIAALLLGLAGVFNRYTAIAILLVGPAQHISPFLAVLKKKQNVPLAPWLLESASHYWLLIFAAPLVAMMITGATILPGVLWNRMILIPMMRWNTTCRFRVNGWKRGAYASASQRVFVLSVWRGDAISHRDAHRGGPWAAMYQCQFTSVMWTVLSAIAVFGAVAGSRPQTNVASGGGCRRGALHAVEHHACFGCVYGKRSCILCGDGRDLGFARAESK